MIIGLVAAGCGVSILPEPFKSIRIKGVCYRPIAGKSAVMELMLASRRGEANPPADAFARMAASIAAAAREAHSFDSPDA